jgi:predicted Zn-dependent protease
METEQEKMAQESEEKLRDVSDKLRKKVTEDEALKVQVSSFHKNQVELLEEMLTSKATMLLKLPQDFQGQEKEKAQIYFDRAMNAVLSRNYARAKYELEQVLLIEPDNQMAINILASLGFLLERKQ